MLVVGPLKWLSDCQPLTSKLKNKCSGLCHVPRQRYMDKFKNSINEIQGASKHPKGSYLEVGTYTVNVL